jgi:hypothetical protein
MVPQRVVRYFNIPSYEYVRSFVGITRGAAFSSGIPQLQELGEEVREQPGEGPCANSARNHLFCVSIFCGSKEGKFWMCNNRKNVKWRARLAPLLWLMCLAAGSLTARAQVCQYTVQVLPEVD